jgi:hypothetical protein
VKAATTASHRAVGGAAKSATYGIDGGGQFAAAWPRKSAGVRRTQDNDLSDEQGGNMATLSPSPSSEPISGPSSNGIEMKLEVVVIPVAAVDRSKEFYTKLGWRLDADFPFDNGFRVVQFTPPGSGCSVQFGTKMTPAAPGSA